MNEATDQPEVFQPSVGLREAHAHLAALGESLVTPSLATCASVAECLHQVRERASERRSGGWVRFLNARVEGWTEARWPTIGELDAATGDVPCIIKSFDHHAAVANTAAINAAGLRPGERVPPNGEVSVDASGCATGLLMEQAAWAVWQAAPEPTWRERVNFVRAAISHLKRCGFVQVHDMFSQDWLGNALAELDAADELAMEVWLYAPVESAEAFESRPWEGDRIRFAGLKVFADGTLNSRTAWMSQPYVESARNEHAPAGEWFGKAMMSPADMLRAMERSRSMGVGLAVHAIGDAAVRMTLDAWERSGFGGKRATNGAPLLRIEHCEVVDAADVPRFASLGVTCSVQPCHLLYDVEALTRYLPHCLQRVLPLRELIDAGCRPGELLWFGSDVPIVPADPMLSVVASMKRRREGMKESEAIGWEQRIRAGEAWAAFCGNMRG